MQQKDPVKVEIWLDGEFYNKIDVVGDAGYSPVAVIQLLQKQLSQDPRFFTKKIEIRRAL